MQTIQVKGNPDMQLFEIEEKYPHSTIYGIILLNPQQIPF